MTTVNVEYGGNVVQVQVGENTQAALNAATAATTQADSAQAAAAQAELFSLAIQLLGAGIIYDTDADGVDPDTGVASGEYFVTWEDARVRLYLNDDGMAVEKAEFSTVAGNALSFVTLANLANGAVNKGAALVGYGSNTSYADGTVGNELIPRVTRTLMKAIPGKQYKLAYLHEAGREGLFQCFPGSAPTDTREGLYIVANAGSFYWARVWDKVNGKAEWFGASQGASDNGPAINAALALCPVVHLEKGIYFVETTIKLTGSGQVLRGVGQQYVDDSSICTRIATTSATLTVIQMGPDSAPVGGVNAFPRGMRIEDLFVGRTVGPDKTAKPIGVSLQFCIGAEVNRVRSVDHTTSFKCRGTVGPRIIGTNANRVSNGTGSGTDEWQAYWFDGDVDIGLAGGNASIYTFQTQAGCNNASLQAAGSIGYRLTGKFQDTFLMQPESVTCNVGISMEGGAGSGDADVKIFEPVMDAVQKWGIYAANLSASSTVNIIDPYVAGVAGAQFGLYFNGCAGSLNVIGGDVLGASTSYSTGAAVGIAGCHGITIRDTILKDLAGTGVGISGTCSSLDITTAHHNPNVTGGAAVQLNGTPTASVFAPKVSGKASAFTHGIQVVGTADARNEYRMTGVNSGCISGGSGNKLVRNGVQITATGATGTNVASGVMA